MNPPPHQQQSFSVSIRTKAPPHTQTASQAHQNSAAPVDSAAHRKQLSHKRDKKQKIYPQVPKLQNDPRTISLAVLIQSMCSLAANTLLAYQDFAGANDDTHQKQKMFYLFELREKFLKLYITLKFLTKIDYNQLMEMRAELTQLQELAYCFQFASDSLFFVNDLTKRMKEAPWDVPVASHVLIEGKFNMLPKSLEAESFHAFSAHDAAAANGEDAMESDNTLDEKDSTATTTSPAVTTPKSHTSSSILFISQSEREQHDMQRLIHDHLLLYLLGTSIPPEMLIEDFKEGVVNVRVPGQFKAQLTLTTRNKLQMPLKLSVSTEDGSDSEPKPDDYHLKLVKLRLLTNQVDILASSLDSTVTDRLARLIQLRFDQRLHPHPLVDLYQTVHRVCLRLGMDILYQQSLQLGRGRLKNLIQVQHKFDEESRELRFVVGYWLGAPAMKAIESSDSVPRSVSQKNTTEALGSVVPRSTASFRNHFSFKPTLSAPASGYRSELDLSLLGAINSLPAGEIHVFVNSDKQCLTVEHQPCQLMCSVPLDEFLEEQVSNLSNLNFSAIIMKCVKMHTRERLYTVQQYIERESDLATRLDSAGSNLIVTLFEQYEVNIFVDWRTGKFQFELLYDQQLVFPEDAESNSLLYFGESNQLLSISDVQEQVNYRPHTITHALLDIQSKCILYAYTRAAHILDYDTFPKSLYEKIRRKIVDVSTNKILRENNCIYISFPNGKNLIHIRVEKVDVESPTNKHGGTVKKIKTTLSLLLMAQNFIMHTPTHQGTVATARNGLSNFANQTSLGKQMKRRKMETSEFSSAIDHLNSFVKENRRAVVRHTLYQGLISLRAVFHETDEPGLISMNYLISDDTVDHSKTRIFIRTTEHDSWSAEIRCAFPSVFPPEKSLKEEQFHSVHNREPSKAKIEIVSHDSEDDSTPSGHSIFLHFSMDTDTINIFYTDLKMLHVMSNLARQLEELKSSADQLFPHMTYKVRKCHYSGIIIEYSPRGGEDTLAQEQSGPYYARIRCERGNLRLLLAPSHDMQSFVDLHLKTHRDMAKFLRLLESVCIPMIQVHKNLSSPQDHWTILSRNLGQLRLEYRKRNIIYELRLEHGQCLAREFARGGSGFPVFEDRRPSSEIHILVQRMCEHAQSKYISMYLQKRTETALERQVLGEGHIAFKRAGIAFTYVLRWNPTTYHLNFSAQCEEDILSAAEKNNLQQTFQQLYNRSETLDFRSSLSSFGYLLLVPPTYIRALMEHICVQNNDPLAASGGQNCKLLLQVPSNLSLPPQLARSAQQNNSEFHNKYTYESSFFIENQLVHMLFRFSNPQDVSEYVDIPIVLFVQQQQEQVNFKFFDCTPPERIGEQILSQAQQETQNAGSGLFFSHVIGVCKRTPISLLRNML
mmetsp:Transcript_7639/g.28637  ORF Transcript_7639/g.28637 Transcript_7639/m.28637 type:complete len:1389 (-) Transcript_7639:847-5013(-)|eukprot:CAMPEP_0117450810 /NCGR_PEP_ID=MMETSP0759-20121206/8667_1 /TAXON_ID=63605 /ORGANISM="Percolomonas cosmopolitus, Strain WS" /LENGTH=1388 /DNA_ID=CAMNT_0005243357 /DNA_START=271 /DNA_END=4437 /DNA_ORIENTATION=-